MDMASKILIVASLALAFDAVAGINFMRDLERMTKEAEENSGILPQAYSADGKASDRSTFNATAFLIEFVQRYQVLLADYKNTTDVPKNKGTDFPNIKGPENLNDRIAIVGAGPSGCHMAWQLAEAGYTDITIYEKHNRIGGKSNDVLHRGTHFTTSTYLFTPDYEDNMWAFFLNQSMGNLVPWTSTIRTVNDWTVPPPASPLLLTLAEEQLTLEQFFALFHKYVAKHREAFGIYEGELPREPSPEVMATLDGTIAEWLRDNGMAPLVSLMDRLLSTPGYSRAETTGALHALMWITPRYMVEGVLGQGTIVAVEAQGGFNAIFQRMLELAGITPKFETEVLRIRKRWFGGFKLSLSTQEEEEDFDFVIWSGMWNDLPKVANWRALPDPYLRYLLKSQFYKTSAGSVVNMRNLANVGTSEVYAQNMLQNNSFNHLVHIVTDVYAEYNQIPAADYAARNYSINGIPVSDTYRTFSVGCYGDAAHVETPKSQQWVHNQIRTHFSMYFNATDIDILHTDFVEYLPQWSVDNIAMGANYRLFEFQGEHGMWFIGGGGGWDSTKSVWKYNELILEKAGIPIVKPTVPE